jgi:hypothetical protein
MYVSTISLESRLSSLFLMNFIAWRLYIHLISGFAAA